MNVRKLKEIVQRCNSKTVVPTRIASREFQKKILKKTLKGRAFVGVSENERIEVELSCP